MKRTFRAQAALDTGERINKGPSADIEALARSLGKALIDEWDFRVLSREVDGKNATLGIKSIVDGRLGDGSGTMTISWSLTKGEDSDPDDGEVSDKFWRVLFPVIS